MVDAANLTLPVEREKTIVVVVVADTYTPFPTFGAFAAFASLAENITKGAVVKAFEKVSVNTIPEVVLAPAPVVTAAVNIVSVPVIVIEPPLVPREAAPRTAVGILPLLA
jgi:hypothetical protein